LTAQQVAIDCRHLLKEIFSQYDVLMMPSAPGEAPPGLKSTGNSIFNRIWTALHVPAVTVPVFTGPSNLPMGLQLVGAFGCYYNVLACAEWVHRKLT
jgi:Asp-tRNA(Asn)/Glu-tRNA(Gln) amidotransferase A subunit family amidase